MESQQPKPVPPQQPQNPNLAFGQDMFSDLNKDLNNIGNNGGNIPNPQPPQSSSDNNINMNNMNNININSNQNSNQNQNTFNLDDWKAFDISNGSSEVQMDSNSQNNSTKDMNQVDPNLFNVFNNINMNPPSNQNQEMNAPNYDFTANMDPKKK